MVEFILRYAKPVYRSLHFPPAVIFLAVMALTVWSAYTTHQRLNDDLEVAVNTHIADNEQTLRSRLASYEGILRGAVGLFQGSQEVTKSDWHHYLGSYDLPQNYPGVQGVGYITWVPAGNQTWFVNYMRSQGMENFHIKPADPPRSEYAVLQYFYPESERNQARLGYDMLADPIRSAAMLRARETKNTTISSRVQLLVTNADGFNMYLPNFALDMPLDTVPQRQTAIRGFVYAAFRAENFFKEVANSQDALALRVTVGNTTNNVLYQSNNYSSFDKKANTISITRTLQLYGEAWNIEYIFNKESLLSRAQLRGPAFLLFIGTLTAFLIAVIALLLLRTRTHELVSQKEAAVDLAKDELLSLASHQLRTPATGVKQYLGMVLQGFVGDVPANQRPLLEKAYASNDRQLHIINEILHLAKIDSGRIVLARQNTDLNTLIRDTLAEQQPDITAAGHTIVAKLPRQTVHLLVDVHMLRMAIENLLSNAIKYTPPGGRITVRLRKSKDAIHITIQDNGVGISAENFAALFKQFSRLPNEMSQQVGGTGIGLYLAKHLVELHGGSIEVRSRANQGSTFTIVLPTRPRGKL